MDRPVERQINLAECKKCFVQRDYSSGLQVRFSAEFPYELDGKIDPDIWSNFINALNSRYQKADSVTFASVMESTISFLTCHLAKLCYPSVWSRVLKETENFIEERNRAIFIPNNLFVRDPATKGLRVIEISILDEFIPPPPSQHEPTSTTPMLTPRD
uniref:Golgin subfamily A member 7/ERF4 domain-containing protein n=1 Tax=Panagrolaimus sp. JU765 TaxID=591449 RepID=A0AC34QP34_9BILA